MQLFRLQTIVVISHFAVKHHVNLRGPIRSNGRIVGQYQLGDIGGQAFEWRTEQRLCKFKSSESKWVRRTDA